MTRPMRVGLERWILGLVLVGSLGAVGCGGEASEDPSAGDPSVVESAAKAPSSKGSCTRRAPGVAVDNNWQWGSPGSFGLQGQQLTYSINVTNYDVGCSSSTFVVTVSAPDGFSVSFPTSTIGLKAGSSGYLLAYVTSPGAIVDGDYPLTVTVQRAGSADTASTTSWYKVYSSDTVAPTMYWPSPGDGATITGRSYNVAVSSRDDHAVAKIELTLDGAQVMTQKCGNVAYTCQLTYGWAPSSGPHTATFTSYDWLGNVSVLTSSFTVQ